MHANLLYKINKWGYLNLNICEYRRQLYYPSSITKAYSSSYKATPKGKAVTGETEQGYDFDAYIIPQMDFTKGYTVPAAAVTKKYLKMTAKSKIKTTAASKEGEEKEMGVVNLDNEFHPVFRVSPYDAEQKKCHHDFAQILILEEGNVCRSVFAKAILTEMVEVSGLSPDVSIEASSIGPVIGKSYDKRVQEAALLSDITLPEFSDSVFDAVTDIVNYDLVLVMDRFDYDEIYREISVLDTINPVGYYCSRLKLLKTFSLIDPTVVAEPDLLEISDPFYGNVGDPEESETLAVNIQQIRNSCKCLIKYLLMLKSRCNFEVTLQSALTQSLRCPLIENSARSRADRASTWHPVWIDNFSKSKRFYTVESVEGGNCKIVQKRMSKRKPHRYWQDIDNVERELRIWMKNNDFKTKLPKHKDIRNSGEYALSSAIVRHGGIRVFAERFKMEHKRKSRDYWLFADNLKFEIEKWLKEYAVEFNLKDKQMPTRRMLTSTGYNALASAISLHGGVEGIAKQMGYTTCYHGFLYWKKNFKKEIEPFLVPDLDGKIYFPTQRELMEARRYDLLGLIQRKGGTIKVARELGVLHRKSHARQCSTIIGDIRVICKELNLKEDEWPSFDTLKKIGKVDLVKEIKSIEKYEKLAIKADATILKEKGFLDGALDELLL